MKKLLFSLVVLLGVGMAARVEAAGSNRGAKGMTPLMNTTTVTAISTGPAVLYEVILGTPTAYMDFVTVFDSGSVIGLSATSLSSTLRARLFLSSGSVTVPWPTPVVVQFDPPLQFNAGIMAAHSAGTNQATFVYEKGRVSQGY